MAGRVPREGQARYLELAVGQVRSEDLVLKLFVNDVPNERVELLADLEEPTVRSYQPIRLAGAGWTATPGDPTQATYPMVTFVFQEPVGWVYGYFLVQRSSGRLMGVERFADGPYEVRAPGDAIDVLPVLEWAVRPP